MYLKNALNWYGFQLPLYEDTDAGILENDLSLGDDDKTDDKTDDTDDDNTDDNTDDDSTDDNTDDDKTDDDTDDKTEEDENEEETNEEENEEDEEEGSKEEDSKRYTAFKDIKAAYPDFFKKFPDLRGVIARESQYSEFFGSPEDAQNAVKDAIALHAIEEDIMIKHDPRGLLEVINKNSPEAVESVVLNMLPYLQEKHKDLYYELAAVPIKQLLRNAWAEGKGKETDLGKAAAILHKFFFKDYEFNEKVKGEGSKPKEKSTREQELEQQLNKINEGKQTNFLAECDQSYTTRISRVIEERISNDERLTPYMRGKVLEDVMKEIRNQLNKDTRYKSSMQSLLRQARTSDYTSDSKSRIISTALARARALVPDVAKRVVANALKTKAATSNNTGNKKLKFKPRVQNNNQSQNRNRNDSGKPKSDMDILRGA